ncbi:MAG: hypothetical protein D6732_17135 [Methanobacteriota archaeon]|nr:MAG: hypothetical protein D6732_17135 [Euryarchaeota archaeon]
MRKTFFTLIVLLVSMVSMSNAFIEEYPVVMETEGQASLGSPEILTVDLTQFKYFLRDYYWDPPALLTLTNVSVNGVFQICHVLQ